MNLWEATLGYRGPWQKKTQVNEQYKWRNRKQQNTHLSHVSVSFVLSFLCNALELQPFASSRRPYWLSSAHRSSPSHVPDDTIQVNSVKKTSATVVISEPRLWHSQGSCKDVFYSFPSATQVCEATLVVHSQRYVHAITFFTCKSWRMSGMRNGIWQQYTWAQFPNQFNHLGLGLFTGTFKFSSAHKHCIHFNKWIVKKSCKPSSLCKKK